MANSECGQDPSGHTKAQLELGEMQLSERCMCVVCAPAKQLGISVDKISDRCELQQADLEMPTLSLKSVDKPAEATKCWISPRADCYHGRSRGKRGLLCIEGSLR